jgi:uncharacterized protein (TIGR02300 family)
VAKPEWGIQRTCQHCDTHFYDMKKDPITCPKCLSIYDEKALLHKRTLASLEAEDLDQGGAIDDILEEDDFFLDAPSDLMETLEDLDEELETKQSVHI